MFIASDCKVCYSKLARVDECGKRMAKKIIHIISNVITFMLKVVCTPSLDLEYTVATYQHERGRRPRPRVGG